MNQWLFIPIYIYVIHTMISLLFHIAKAPPPRRHLRTSLSSVQRRRSRWAQKAWTSGQKLAGRQQSSTSKAHMAWEEKHGTIFGGGLPWFSMIFPLWSEWPITKLVSFMGFQWWFDGILMGLNWINQGKMLISLDFRMISGCTTKKTVGLMAVNTQTLWFQKFNEPNVGFQCI